MRILESQGTVAIGWVCALGAILGMVGCQSSPLAQSSSTEEKAVAYLSREVPLWFQENQCYSCHNNGDAARALCAAAARGLRVPASSIQDTLDWLGRPGAWDHNKGDPGFSDRRLARIQFALALGAAIEAGLAPPSEAWRQAAVLVVEEQDPDGAWPIGPDLTLGSPVTYGTHLATALVLRFLRQSLAALGPNQSLEQARLRAEAWLRRAPVRNVLEAASVLLGIQHQKDAPSEGMRQQGLDLLRQAQSNDGGWGPYANAAPEPFDTAVVLLALEELEPRWQAGDMISRGRSFLKSNQREDGSWVETTRPPRGQSYAQRMSTTGWAALALLATAESKAGQGGGSMER